MTEDIKLRSQNHENRRDLPSTSSPQTLRASFTAMQMQFKTVLEKTILFFAITLSDSAIFIFKNHTVKRTMQ